MRESLSYRHNCDVVITWTRRGICPLVSHSEQGCFPRGQTPEKLSGLRYTVPFKLIGRHFSGFWNIRAQMLRVYIKEALRLPQTLGAVGGENGYCLNIHLARAVRQMCLCGCLCVLSAHKRRPRPFLCIIFRGKKKKVHM